MRLMPRIQVGFDLGRSDSDLLEPWFVEIMRPAAVFGESFVASSSVLSFLPSESLYKVRIAIKARPAYASTEYS